jgi:uncharacterized DUF497 family protein
MIYHLAIIVSMNESLIYLLNYGMTAGSGGVLICKAKSNTYMTMPLLGVEWDEEKNAINKAVHHIDFVDAQYIFSDSERLERIDRSEGNVSGEERLQALGMVGKILFVVYVERGENKRLISARLATKAERRSYNGYYHIDGSGWYKAS